MEATKYITNGTQEGLTVVTLENGVDTTESCLLDLQDQAGDRQIVVESKSGAGGVNYGDVLKHYGLEPYRVDCHWQVGRLDLVQGWLLDLSIIRSQISLALETLIPYLKSTQVPFRIVQDYETAISALDGNMGRDQIGKVVTVYPPADGAAVKLANELIQLTGEYKGPVVLTDIHLGGCVYTRYGAFSGVQRSNDSGLVERYLYNVRGDLVRDIASIPFTMPEGRSWPFGGLADPVTVREKSAIYNRCRVLVYLKQDPRGDVFKAHYLTKHFRVKTCIVKQGVGNMWSDDHGRDMRERLRWQKVLYDRLKDVIPLPRIYDLLEEGGDTYLVMELVRGKSVFAYVTENLNPNCEWFYNWTKESQLEAIHLLFEICTLVQTLHDHGFAHRDVTPVNFLVEKRRLSRRLFGLLPGKKQLGLRPIDIELAVSLAEGKPEWPFTFGTFGFMSPQQSDALTPTEKEDSYGLAATILTIIAGIPALSFDTANKDWLETSLQFFLRDIELVRTIAAGLSFYPGLRPSAADFKQALQRFKGRLAADTSRSSKSAHPILDQHHLREIVQDSLRGLVQEPTVIAKGIWQTRSKEVSDGGKPNNMYFKSGGLYEGISGILYVIAEARIAGLDISDCQEAYNRNWSFLQERYLKVVHHLPPGLYGGAAGMAVAIARGMEAGLIPQTAEQLEILRACLGIPSVGLDHQSGSAGQGIAALKCAALLGPSYVKQYLFEKSTLLLGAQDDNGTWFTLREPGKKAEPGILFEKGNTGILLFLLEQYVFDPQGSVLQAIQRGLVSCSRMCASIKERYRKGGFRGHLKDIQLQDGYKGLIRVFLKAYEVLKSPPFKECAEDLLQMYPTCFVHEDFALQFGQAGIGLLCLQAHELTGNIEWKKRAFWLCAELIHLGHRSKRDSIYWLNNNLPLPTAELMAGNTGIIHFLMKCLSHLESISFPDFENCLGRIKNNDYLIL